MHRYRQDLAVIQGREVRMVRDHHGLTLSSEQCDTPHDAHHPKGHHECWNLELTYNEPVKQP